MNPIAKEIASYLGSAQMNDEEFLQHYGVKRRSGRYPWGSGEDPYQRGIDFLGRIEKLKKSGWKETTENIKKEFGITSTQYRREKRIAQEERKMLRVETAKALKEDGLGATEIGRRMGVRESTVRGWIEGETESKMRKTKETAALLKKHVDEKKMIDVGRNQEIELNISRERLDTALLMLEREGYHVYSGRIPQATNKNQATTQKVLTTPDKKHADIFNYDEVHTINEYITRDGGDTFEKKFTYPSSMNSKRLKIRYADDVDKNGATGNDKDGIVELRRGVEDLSLGKSRYSQVRILVDGTHYIKGMAVYSDDMPDGIDVVFNTNKTKAKCPTKKDVLKKITDDPDNPFGSNIKDVELGGQYWYTDKNGKKKLGLINKRSDEGDWSEWADKLPSQFLSKQSQSLAKKQLDLAKAEKEDEFNTIMSLNNPTIKKYYLNKFASSCDSAAVDLKAASLPGQKYHVIVPVNTLKDTEIYAPQYKPGTKLALVRYPHGGIFEIPILTVTDKNKIARDIIGSTSNDAVCINKKIADRLSGADFDGDTVMCIPTHDRRGKVKIINKKPLEDLEGFDPKLRYGSDNIKTDPDGTKHYYRNGKEYKPMPKSIVNKEMGIISNLITDMTIAGANEKEIAKAVKHSMVVIDAEKHKLDYKQSYIENDIATLQRRWQPKYDDDGKVIGGGGASTLISKSKGEKRVDKRKGEAHINTPGKKWYDPSKPEGSLVYTTAPDKELYYVMSNYNKKTGRKTIKTVGGKPVEYDMNDPKARSKYEPLKKKNPKTGKYEPVFMEDPKTGEMYTTNRDGSIKYRVDKRTVMSTNMAETTDAYTLVSRNKHQIEIIYADYANSMKAMANRARIEMLRTPNLEYSPNAAKIYKKEVSSLNEQLNKAKKNSIKERTVLRLTAAELKRRKESNPDMTPGEEQKISQRLQTKYREQVGAVSRKKRGIQISDREWEAVQAGAISESKLKEILDNSDADILRQRAMPKASNSLSTSQINRIKRMSSSNFTLAQIAEKMNLSPSTVSKYLKGVE